MVYYTSLSMSEILTDQIMTMLYRALIDFVLFIHSCLPPNSDCAPKTPAPQAMDDAAAKKLWDLSASMVGLA